MRHLAAMILAAILLAASCTIEPPLLLPQNDVQMHMPVVVTDISVVWDVDYDWKEVWDYGWDEEDVANWGKLEYPMPTYFEVRRFYTGDEPGKDFLEWDGFTIYAPRFRAKYNFGYYNLMVWSNIDSEDGTQVVVIDEKDMNNIMATTTPTRLSYVPPKATRTSDTRNQPEIFYCGHENNIYISRNVEDYDYVDEVEHVWVKELHSLLQPVVYIYLVQVEILNNKGKIQGISDQASLSGLADGVSLHTTATTETDAYMAFPMRMKQDIKCHDGVVADIIGGKLTTFGLCGMQGWAVSRSPHYSGTRHDLDNTLALHLRFSNQTDSTLAFNVTDQMQAQAHGGVITIRLDADDITLPSAPTGGSGSGFKPTVEDYGDSIVHEFGI